MAEEATRRSYMLAGMMNAAMTGKLGKLAEWLPGKDDTSEEPRPPEDMASAEL